MKRIMIVTAGALLFSAATTFAQDTARTQQRPKQDYQKKDQQQQNQTLRKDQTQTQKRDQTQTQKQGQTDVRKRDQAQTQRNDQEMTGWTRVNNADVPSSLRTTLGDTKYQGWENATVYRNDKDSRYRIKIGNQQNAKTYYFDKSGKAMPESRPRSDK
jgi:uncharacterized protein YxeA